MFERFTERARQVVVLAQDEARALKHNYIGTEHILLGLLREQDGIAARVLGSLGVTLAGVRTQVVRIVGQGDEETPGQIPFTPRGTKVLELSLREGLALGHDYIGTEHVLLGLVRENEGVATRILLHFDADAEKIRGAVVDLLGGEPEGYEESMRKAVRVSPTKSVPAVASAMGQPTSRAPLARDSRRRSRRESQAWCSARAVAPRSAYAPLMPLIAGAALFAAGLLVGRLIWG